MSDEPKVNLFELIRCVQINLENAEKQLPIINQVPYYLIAKTQLAEAVKALEP